jgi:N-acyl-D-aspartate/D-glutamate deacylase
MTRPIADTGLISGDDHMGMCYVPPDLWQDRLDARWREAPPRVVALEGGRTVWVKEGRTWGVWGSNTADGRMVPFDAVGLAEEPELRQCFYQPMSTVDPAVMLTMLKRPDTVIAASDSGAHVSQILDSSIPGYFLAHWVRERQAFDWPEAVRMLTHDPAQVWGFEDRGELRPGCAADVVVFDPETVGSSPPTVVRDLPDGGPRLFQMGTGFDAVSVGGQITWQDGIHTGALPGRLIRGSLNPVGAGA